ncbi:aspartate dehydrogenase [Candidatus Woesearchaeota archaeon]|nr:aspartate dehydrogenase [Candidatus Woesearchaeota archaeon]
MNIGIIGCGTIGSELAKSIEKFKDVSIVALCDVDEEKAKRLLIQLSTKPQIVGIDRLIEISELVIESASKHIVKEVAEKTFYKGKDLMIMSVGGIISNEHLLKLAEEKNCNLYIPSGAICGIDGVNSASIGKINSVTLTTTKPPKALEGAPYIVKNNLNLNTITKKTIIFEGSALEAVDAFPANINVAASLSIAGIGAEKTKVKIVADPNSSKNMHEIVVEGDFGKLTTVTENLPSPNNPKTSYLAVLSAISMVKKIVGNVKVGN